MADIECDVLIVGSGIGGLTALLAARMAGLKPILIEKSHRVGGNTSRSSGMLWLPNNPLMIRQRVHDSRDAAVTYLANFTGVDDLGSSDARRAAFVDGVAPLVAMLEAHGVPLVRCHGYSDHYDLLPGGNAAGRMLETPLYDTRKLGRWRARLDRPRGAPLARGSELARVGQLGSSWAGRSLSARIAARTMRSYLGGNGLVGAGAALQGYLLEVALRLGADIRTNAGLVDLTTQAGRVSGALVDFDGWQRHVHAPHGVIIATGGFARNPAMRAQYIGDTQGNDGTHVATGDTGEPIARMIAAGAVLAWMQEAWWVLRPQMRNADQNSDAGDRLVPELHKPHVILVDREGRRFVNEADDRMRVGRACREPLADGTARAVPAYAILDARHRRRYGADRAWFREGAFHKSGSLSALALMCNLPPDTLKTTVERWNALCGQGADSDFGKGKSAYNRYYGDLSLADNPCLGSISEPPFYAVPLIPGDIGTCGGVVADEHARVLREDGSAIEGLFAVGNCTAPIAGPHDVAAGQTGGTAAVFGVNAVRCIIA